MQIIYLLMGKSDFKQNKKRAISYVKHKTLPKLMLG
jgi:hypothetical protein